MAKRDNKEFYNLVEEYINHPKIMEMKEYTHHGIKRYDHCFRVAYHTYRVTKFLNLDYKSATKAAMLHDFFTDELKEEKSSIARYQKHPEIAAENAKKYFELNELEEDIIKTHMFPVSLKLPKYRESWIVDAVDDGVSIYEKFHSIRREVKSFANIILLMIFTFFR